MKFILTISALMAAIIAMAADNAMVPTLALSLTANATDILTANGIWAPNLTAFAMGEPNTAGIDHAAEAEKLLASGININDLVYFSINMAAPVSEKMTCNRCSTCMKACGATLIFYAFCAAACQLQSYCQQCGPHHG